MPVIRNLNKNINREFLIFWSELTKNLLFLTFTGLFCGILASAGLSLTPWTPNERVFALPVAVILGQLIYTLLIAQRAFFPDLEDRAILRFCDTDERSVCYFSVKLLLIFVCSIPCTIAFFIALTIFGDADFYTCLRLLPIVILGNFGLLPTPMLLNLFANTSNLNSIVFLVCKMFSLPIFLIEGSIIYTSLFPPFYLDNLPLLAGAGGFIVLINLLLFPKIRRLF